MKNQATSFLASSFAAIVLLTSGSISATAQVPTAAREHPLTEYAAAGDPPLFDTSDEAITAFKKAVEGGDVSDLAALVGLDVSKVKSNDEVLQTYADISARAQERVLSRDLEGMKVLEIGNELWPFPFPIVEGDGGKWYFDTFKGLEETANRYLGANELHALITVRAYVEAQEEYASQDHDRDGVLEYAQKLVSSEGTQDGLYWPADQWDGSESPGGAGLAEAAVDREGTSVQGYDGYRYRVLTKQGSNIAGGEYDYVINDNMIAGFAVVAWPTDYGVSGVNTFVVNRSGVVYEADLGEDTAAIASAITTFNPGDDWRVVAD